MCLVKPQCFFEPNNPLEYQPRSSRAIRFLHDRDDQGDLPREWEGCNTAPPPLNAHQQAGRGDTGACWHPPQASVYSDKITHRAMSWWGHSGTLYLRVKTLTNLPPRLRSVKGSKCTWVCQRRTQRVDMGPYQAWWRNGHRTITASHQLWVWGCVPRGGLGLDWERGEVPQGNVRWPSSHSAAPDALPLQNWPPNSSDNDTC